MKITAADCRRAVAHLPAADVQYKPGVDARGRKVAAADLPGQVPQATKTRRRNALMKLQEGISRERLLERAWGYDFEGGARAVDSAIKRLRAKLEPDPGEPKYLVTVRGLGYKLDL